MRVKLVLASLILVCLGCVDASTQKRKLDRLSVVKPKNRMHFARQGTPPNMTLVNNQPILCCGLPIAIFRMDRWAATNVDNDQAHIP